MQCMRLGACSATALLLAVLFSPMLQSSLAASPPLELAKWNKAYKLTVNNINSIELATYNLIEPGCSKDFDSNAARVPLGSCFYRQNTGGTYSKWNKLAGDWRVNSNCYCYALNVYKGGYCIPGFSNQALVEAYMTGQPKTCELMMQAVLADGAKWVSRNQALSAEEPAAGYYIGLLVRAKGCTPAHCWNADFHVVRKDSNGLWSWKEPGGPASALDANGQPVSDPQAASMPGHYDQWCGYFLVNPATMSIAGNFDTEYSLPGQVEWLSKLPGVVVALQETPYNQTVDGASDTLTQQQLKDNAEWDKKRGTKEWNDFCAQRNASSTGGYDEHYSVQRGGLAQAPPVDLQPPPGVQQDNAGDLGSDGEADSNQDKAGDSSPPSNSSGTAGTTDSDSLNSPSRSRAGSTSAAGSNTPAGAQAAGAPDEGGLPAPPGPAAVVATPGPLQPGPAAMQAVPCLSDSNTTTNAASTRNSAGTSASATATTSAAKATAAAAPVPPAQPAPSTKQAAPAASTGAPLTPSAATRRAPVPFRTAPVLFEDLKSTAGTAAQGRAAVANSTAAASAPKNADAAVAGSVPGVSPSFKVATPKTTAPPLRVSTSFASSQAPRSAGSVLTAAAGGNRPAQAPQLGAARATTPIQGRHGRKLLADRTGSAAWDEYAV